MRRRPVQCWRRCVKGKLQLQIMRTPVYASSTTLIILISIFMGALVAWKSHLQGTKICSHSALTKLLPLQNTHNTTMGKSAQSEMSNPLVDRTEGIHALTRAEEENCFKELKKNALKKCEIPIKGLPHDHDPFITCSSKVLTRFHTRFRWLQ